MADNGIHLNDLVRVTRHEGAYLHGNSQSTLKVIKQPWRRTNLSDQDTFAMLHLV
jgi:hypothetical protein